MALKRGAQKNNLNIKESEEEPWQSTPAPASKQNPPKKHFEEKIPFSELPSPVEAKTNVSKDKKPPPMLDMICQAIKSLEGGRKGSSVPAIKKWIMGNYIGIDENRVNLRLKKALAKGLETGALGRPTKSSDTIGAKGFFIVKPVVKKSKTPKTKPKKKDDLGVTHVSDSEMTVSKPNHRKSKMHASDTDLPSDSAEAIKPKVMKKTKSEPKKTKKPVEKTASKTTEKKTPQAKPSTSKKQDKIGKTDANKKPEAKSKEKPAKKEKAPPKSKKVEENSTNKTGSAKKKTTKK